MIHLRIKSFTVSFVAQVQSLAELKMLLEADLMDEMKKKLDKLFMVLVLNP